jgi:hypothetical protein
MTEPKRYNGPSDPNAFDMDYVAPSNPLPQGAHREQWGTMNVIVFTEETVTLENVQTFSPLVIETAPLAVSMNPYRFFLDTPTQAASMANEISNPLPFVAQAFRGSRRLVQKYAAAIDSNISPRPVFA